MLALTAANLAEIATSTAVPTYDRSEVTAGIAHFGVGGFHRAHQAMYVDRLLNAGGAREWGICGVGLMPGDRAMRDAMAAQDCLFTMVVKDADGTWTPQVVGSIVEYLYAPDDPDAVIERLAAPAIRIVSLTITEGGYNVHRVTGEFMADNPAIQADLADPSRSATAFGIVVEALARRRERGVPPFTVMSCDNVQGNGDVARRAFTAFARLRGGDLGDWVEREVAFPNSMVDRITPVTTDADRAEIERRFGITDRWPVTCEPFTQWVLEDAFTAGRPAFEDVGVQVVGDVEPYELMKLRLLNASHQALAYSGYLAGYRLVHEVCQDPAWARFLLDYMRIEAIPTLHPVPGIDLDRYTAQLIERFSNPEVRDTVARLCANSSDMMSKFLLPVIRHNVASGGPVERSAAAIACWARYDEGVDEQGEPIDVVDPLKEQLTAAARRQREDPLAFLRNRDIFGDLADDPRFAAAYTGHLAVLHDQGVRAMLDRLNAT
ncbi:mannitol dehydrogenase family protein [Spirilliplanes yamanashiensis]|uniref:Mannitol-1-phosphate 5-dehydrogenase n=1 Tax=Spirilliplanes yamanashiensis TaxID=42233 RepID=A0A8J3Y511_9ACTN|nr:mannitol dehydrogenase family protein [Spirilliplanes yamanashiensis]MDP9819265.1 mannitol 2-dehydrogenase [Spirilliplanes yamanashiensis]GIJ01911.1 mannitol 2-dehydrogenase [Spirilliplanes yamanashiensis]